MLSLPHFLRRRFAETYLSVPSKDSSASFLLGSRRVSQPSKKRNKRCRDEMKRDEKQGDHTKEERIQNNKKGSSISSSGSGADLAPAVCCHPTATATPPTKLNGGQLGGGDRRITNGQSVLHRRDTPAQLSPKPGSPTKQGSMPATTGTPLNGINERSPPTISSFKCAEVVPNIGCAKPISQTESASQADFFRLLDEKIARGAKQLGAVDSDEEE